MANAACIKIKKPADFELIRTNLAGAFCLAQDIDLTSVANFVPIGTDAAIFFNGTLDGKGHTISNLKISSANSYVGLFGYIQDGSVKNLRITAAQVEGSHTGAHLGVLAGENGSGSSVTNVEVDGTATALGLGAEIGGVIGGNDGAIADVRSAVIIQGGEAGSLGGVAGRSSGSIQRAVASGAVGGAKNGKLGGLVGWISSATARIDQSRAFGAVTVTGDYGLIGGLVGDNDGTIKSSHATGPVSGHSYASAGGLVGSNSGTIAQSQATGPAASSDFGDAGGLAGNTSGAITASEAFGAAATGDYGNAGGLVGSAMAGSSIAQGLSIGPVSGGDTFPSLGGLVGSLFAGTVKKSYWDTQTSGLTTSAGGVGLTTAKLRRSLRGGFSGTIWAITPDVTYPYLTSALIAFKAALATTVFDAQAFTFLPISQLDPAQYSPPVVHADEASEAVTFTIIARAVGVARNVAELASAKVNLYWDDAAEEAKWTGALALHAKRGAFTAIPAAQPLSVGNVIGPLSADKLVILRGTYVGESGSTPHWMLATAFTVDLSDEVTGVLADDPWTGVQVTIDPVSKTVISPGGFPLPGFTVDGFVVVTLKHAP
jgi:hypothetical protein